MQKPSYYIVNVITAYRLLAAPVLVFLIFNNTINLFKWMLALSFFTDLIDGVLARKFGVASVFGSKLDSIADDLTVVAAIIGVFILKPQFIDDNRVVFIILFILFVFQTALALIKYRKISSFHTYIAKVAAILQGTFLVLLFFFAEPLYFLFYAAAIVTALDLIEEIILVIIIPKWEANVKGLYWVYKRKAIDQN
ncbi:MAG: CDP-alcohol phosphatidyltransferase family protein [Bacteroidetes bacterium]|nr:CDP-alcohol phosphatidyltransferase family protein [Bacteroidota bacterium]